MSLTKTVAVIAILGTLAAFGSLSYYYSQDRARRVACVQNQVEMQEALVHYQTQHAGNSPRRVWALWRYYSDRPENFATCPFNQDQHYRYDREAGVLSCPNPNHQRDS